MKQYIKNGEIKSQNRIIIKKNGVQILNPSHVLLLEDGWVEYIPKDPTDIDKKLPSTIVEELVIKQWNDRTDISNNEALDYMTIVYPWKKFIDKVLPVGKIVSYEDKLWRVRQEHTALGIYPPSLDTASLYEMIDKEHEGTLVDPIPYMPPMEIFKNKYYIQDNVIYECIRDSEIALTHNLSDLIGLYVYKVQ